MKNLVWVGIRQSEIMYSNFVIDSINLFGDNCNSLQNNIKKRINHNNEKNFDLINEYYNEMIVKQIKVNPNIKFMYYSQIYSYDSMKKIGLLDYIVCLNNQDLIRFINNKFKIKEYLEEYIPILNYAYVDKNNYNFKELEQKFGVSEFVIQTEESSGGLGTRLLNQSNKNYIQFENNKKCMVTKYCKENVPINLHILISENDIILLPPSIQNIEMLNNKLVYKGCDFVAYKKIVNSKMDLKFKRYAYIIGELMQKKGYRGVLGIDSILYEDEVYFMEINPRFQNSSTILNKSLQENNLPSLQELNYRCFYGGNIGIKHFDVNYSAYINEYKGSNKEINIKPIVSLDLPNKNLKYEELSYLSTDLYNESIYQSLKGTD